MITEILSQGSDQLPDDEQQPSAILPYKPKARFHWPQIVSSIRVAQISGHLYRRVKDGKR